MVDWLWFAAFATAVLVVCAIDWKLMLLVAAVALAVACAFAVYKAGEWLIYSRDFEAQFASVRVWENEFSDRLEWGAGHGIGALCDQSTQVQRLQDADR